MSVNMSSVLDYLSNCSLKLEKIALKFNSMPSLAISPNLNFSSLIEQVGKNSTEAGTILQSNGYPVAVILSTEQYKGTSGLIGSFSSLISRLHDLFISKEKFDQMSVEVLNEIGSDLYSTSIFILLGTIATVAGAFFLGKRYHEIENDQTKSKSRMSYIMPGVILAVGIGTLAFSAYETNLASRACLDLADGISSL